MLRDHLFRIACALFIVGGTSIAVTSCGSGEVVRGSKGKPVGSADASVDGPSGPILHFEASTPTQCTPRSCSDLGFTCGPNSDGCGNVIQCGSCSGTDYCGGGGYSLCGNPHALPDGALKSTCVPKTCADYPANTCGQQSDGCGGLTDDCNACKAPAFCGGGGASLCGTGASNGADAMACVPKTCADYPTGTCGQQSDGCGALTTNCATCQNPEYCGGDPNHPNTCGGNNGLGVDGGPMQQPCKPKTCADFPAGTCGVQGDGCGGTTPNCSTCKSPAFCGGGGSNLCGTGSGSTGSGGGTCTPKTCAAYPKGTCGQQSDGCGGLTANCGTCTSPTFCGGGGMPGVCGGNNGKEADGAVSTKCVPATCASLGYNCGQAGDGCGGIIGPCGPDCTLPQKCGGGGKPNVCGSSVPCTGLCLQQPSCPNGGTTSLTGTVRAGLQESVVGGKNVFYVPQGTTPDPVPGVLVYVPNAALEPFASDPTKPQVECSQCGADVSGDPLATTTTDFNGKFTLNNVPVSKNASDTIPVVIQLGRWRRLYHFAITKSCAANALPQDLNLPSTSAEGDIPLTAISTGSYDPIECVLLKMGVAEQEFTSLPTWKAETATGTTPKPGRIHIYTATQGNGTANPGSVLAPQQDETVLMGTGNTGSPTNGTYMMYDQILLPCWGDAVQKGAGELSNLGYYGDHGGHFFATHYSYSWLNQNTNSSLSSIANWDPKANQNINPFPNGVQFTGNVSTSVPITVPASNPGMFVKWLNYVNALSNANPTGAPPAKPAVLITAGRHDVDSTRAPSVDWIDGTDPNPKQGSSSEMLLHFTFDMPIQTGATKPLQCGHGIFSDFHVNSATQSNNTTFPNECSDHSAMDSQQKILEYMIFDLASCVPPPPTTTCTAKTCADFPAGTCGQQGDGCGGLTANCGSCPTGQVCGGGGVANKCGNGGGGSCTPKTCAAFAGSCGQQSDGCGGVTASCACPQGQTCVSGTCTTIGGCTPKTCKDYPAGTCGQQSDGCGGLTPDCNPCPSGQTCGGCGVPGQCCTPPTTSCTPQPCPPSLECGPSSDGCGGIIASCGTCKAPETCGGGGVAGKCGGSSGCTPLSCQDQGIACGPAGDGCGNLIQSCGTCTPPDTCGGGGTPGQCGNMSNCVPKTCQDLNIACGPAGDGCGSLIPSCGTCTPPQTCGGGGKPGQCGGGILR